MLAARPQAPKFQEMLEYAGRGVSPYPLPASISKIGPINFPSDMTGTYRPRFALGKVTSMPITPDAMDSRKVLATFYRWMPYYHRAVLIAQPAVAATASVLNRNSWDFQYGLIGSPLAPVVSSNVNYPVAPVPSTGY